MNIYERKFWSERVTLTFLIIWRFRRNFSYLTYLEQAAIDEIGNFNLLCSKAYKYHFIILAIATIFDSLLLAVFILNIYVCTVISRNAANKVNKSIIQLASQINKINKFRMRFSMFVCMPGSCVPGSCATPGVTVWLQRVPSIAFTLFLYSV